MALHFLSPNELYYFSSYFPGGHVIYGVDTRNIKPILTNLKLPPEPKIKPPTPRIVPRVFTRSDKPHELPPIPGTIDPRTGRKNTDHTMRRLRIEAAISEIVGDQRTFLLPASYWTQEEIESVLNRVVRNANEKGRHFTGKVIFLERKEVSRPDLGGTALVNGRERTSLVRNLGGVYTWVIE